MPLPCIFAPLSVVDCRLSLSSRDSRARRRCCIATDSPQPIDCSWFLSFFLHERSFLVLAVSLHGNRRCQCQCTATRQPAHFNRLFLPAYFAVAMTIRYPGTLAAATVAECRHLRHDPDVGAPALLALLPVDDYQSNLTTRDHNAYVTYCT